MKSNLTERQSAFIDNLKYREPSDELERAVIEGLDQYFVELEGAKPLPLHEMVLERIEKIVVTYALVKTGCNFGKTAALLGIHRNTLHTRLRKLKLFKDETLLESEFSRRQSLIRVQPGKRTLGGR